MTTPVARQAGRLVGTAAVAVVFAVYQLGQAGVRLISRLVFLPYFGISGTVFRPGRPNVRYKGLVDWFGYDCRTRRMILQTTSGKTVHTYTVEGVSPLAFLRLSRRPTTEAFHRLFLSPKTYAYHSIWRWRWDGAYRPAHARRVR